MRTGCTKCALRYVQNERHAIFECPRYMHRRGCEEFKELFGSIPRASDMRINRWMNQVGEKGRKVCWFIDSVMADFDFAEERRRARS